MEGCEVSWWGFIGTGLIWCPSAGLGSDSVFAFTQNLKMDKLSGHRCRSPDLCKPSLHFIVT